MLFEYSQILVATISGFVLGAALCTLLEFIYPAEEQSSFSRVRGFFFTSLSLAVAVFLTQVTQETMARLDLQPLFRLDLSQTIHSPDLWVRIAGYTLVPLLSVFLYDVGYYVFHRLQHSVPLLWRYHAVHHSIEELNTFNAYHHVSEYLFRIPLLMVPLNLLIWVNGPQVLITGLILSAVGNLSHSNTKLSFGPFRYIFTEPRYHRVHHSVEPRHWNRNFAFYFPILDMLFRTAHFPTRGECPATGLDYVREPRSLKAFLHPPRPPASEKKEVGGTGATDTAPVTA